MYILPPGRAKYDRESREKSCAVKRPLKIGVYLSGSKNPELAYL
jgi:hypothetical protein